MSADIGFSLLRMAGALLLVLAVFFAGIWLFKNWQRLGGGPRRPDRLQVIEAKSLGNRQVLYVVGFDRQRFLIGASPVGVCLLSPLPEAPSVEPVAPAPAAFATALQAVLNRK